MHVPYFVLFYFISSRLILTSRFPSIIKDKETEPWSCGGGELSQMNRKHLWQKLNYSCLFFLLWQCFSAVIPWYKYWALLVIGESRAENSSLNGFSQIVQIHRTIFVDSVLVYDFLLTYIIVPCLPCAHKAGVQYTLVE